MTLIVSNRSTSQKDVCTKGMSCGVACISKRKDCVKDLSPETANLLEDVIGLVGTANASTVQAAAAGDKKAIKKLEQLDKGLTALVTGIASGELSEEQLDVLYDVYVDRGIKTAETVGMNRTEINQMRKNTSGMQKLFDDVESDLQNLDVDDPNDFDKFIDNRGINTQQNNRSLYQGDKVTKETSNAIWELLPPQVQKKFINSGSVAGFPKVVDFETDSDGNIIGQTRKTTANTGRGKTGGQAMWNLWMRNQGRDIYTGEPLDVRSAELEHISGLTGQYKNGTVDSNKKDSLGNLGWVNRGVNGSKGNQRMEKWLGDINDDTFVNNYFNKLQKNTATKQGIEAKASNYRNVTGTDKKGYIKGNFKNRSEIGNYVANEIVKGNDTAVINKALKQADKVGKRNELQQEIDNVKVNSLDNVSDSAMKRLIKAQISTASNGKSWVRGNPDVVSNETKPNKNGSRPRSGTHSSNAQNIFLSNLLSESNPNVRDKMRQIWNDEINKANKAPGGMNKKQFQKQVINELNKLPEFDIDI